MIEVMPYYIFFVAVGILFVILLAKRILAKNTTRFPVEIRLWNCDTKKTELFEPSKTIEIPTNYNNWEKASQEITFRKYLSIVENEFNKNKTPEKALYFPGTKAARMHYNQWNKLPEYVEIEIISQPKYPEIQRWQKEKEAINIFKQKCIEFAKSLKPGDDCFRTSSETQYKYYYAKVLESFTHDKGCLIVDIDGKRIHPLEIRNQKLINEEKNLVFGGIENV